MRVMVDTNVIISAILKERSLPNLAVNEVCENGHKDIWVILAHKS